MKIILSTAVLGIFALTGCGNLADEGLGDIARTAQSGEQSCVTLEGGVVQGVTRAPVRCGPQSQDPLAAAPGGQLR